MQHAYRNRSGPGLGSFFLVATAAFAVVFALGLLRPSGHVNAYDHIQRLSWSFSNLRAKDFGLAALPSWLKLPGGRSAPAAAPARPVREDPAVRTTYRVEPGDTLSRIAARFGVEVETLIAHNRLVDPDRIEVSQILHIPGDGSAAPAVRASHGPAVAPPPAVSSAPPAAAAPSLSHVDALLAMAEDELSEARFERALHTSVAVERLLGSGGDSEGAEFAARRARMEVVRATAYTAVGHHQQVQNALARALAADPDLELDPATTSPKLLQALDVAREIRALESNDVVLGESAAVTP